MDHYQIILCIFNKNGKHRGNSEITQIIEPL